MRGVVRVAMVLAMVLAMVAGGAVAAEAPIMVDGKPWRYDPQDAADVMRPCAACHGEAGAGGGGGVYPRLAGLNAEYLADQMRKFKSRERENIPMIPYATDRELPERDVLAISRYLSEIQLKYEPPENLPTDGYARLQAMKKMMWISREPGDLAAGQAIYDKDCAPCHGQSGEGRLKKPQLVGQYIKYLRTQIDNFVSGARQHDEVDRIIRPRTAEDWNNVWAYVSSLFNAKAKPAAGTAPAAQAVDYEQ